MEIQNSPEEDDSELALSDPNLILPNLLKEKSSFEDFDINNSEHSTIFSFIFSTFSPNISLSLLSIAFVLERNGIVTTSLVLIYGLLTHIVFSNMTSKLLHNYQKQNISELLREKYLLQKYYNIFCIIYYFCLQMFLILICKDVLYIPFHTIAEKTNFLPLETYKSAISSILFFLSNFVLSIFSKHIQISILIFTSFISCILILCLAFKTFYLNYKNKYGSNRSLQFDNLNINALTSFCFFHFALNFPPLFINIKYSDSSKCSINGFFSTFLKTLFLIICGFSMYVSYGRYINSTQLFSFHESDFIANLCRMSYLTATISMNVVFIDQSKLFVNELFESNTFDLFFRSHKNFSFLIFLIIPIFVSFFIQTSLPFIEICGAISFWIFGVIFNLVFSLSLSENGCNGYKRLFQLFLVSFAVLMFIVVIFCSIRDMIVYYYY